MAGAGFKTYATGDLITATDFNTFIQEQVVMVFSNSTARDSAVSSPSEGMICFLKDTDVLQFYSGSAWSDYIGAGDITGVTITTSSTSGLSGGTASTSGAFSSTLVISPNSATSATPTTSDLTLFGDADDSNALKKATLNDLPISSATQTALDNITAGTSTLTVPITVKVADDGSGSQNVFYFLVGTDTGAGTRSVSMDLATGFKYKFDISDSSNSGHPLKFSTVADGSHGGGSEFTTNVTTSGTAGSSGAFIQLEVTAETLGIAGATSTLYYYCPNHSGMGGSGLLSLLPSAGGGSGTQFDQLLLIGA
jgi:hypothetical protein